jgi:hypothetical protein
VTSRDGFDCLRCHRLPLATALLIIILHELAPAFGGLVATRSLERPGAIRALAGGPAPYSQQTNPLPMVLAIAQAQAVTNTEKSSSLYRFVRTVSFFTKLTS